MKEVPKAVSDTGSALRATWCHQPLGPKDHSGAAQQDMGLGPTCQHVPTLPAMYPLLSCVAQLCPSPQVPQVRGLLMPLACWWLGLSPASSSGLVTPSRVGLRVGHLSGSARPPLCLQLRGRLLPEDTAFAAYLLCAGPCP